MADLHPRRRVGAEEPFTAASAGTKAAPAPRESHVASRVPSGAALRRTTAGDLPSRRPICRPARDEVTTPLARSAPFTPGPPGRHSLQLPAENEPRGAGLFVMRRRGLEP